MASSETGSVHLDTVMCCALWHAFANNREKRREWAQCYDQLPKAIDILRTSVDLTFTPAEMVSRVYRSMAQTELDRLARPDQGDCLQCRHGRNGHVVALKKVLRRLPEQVIH